MALTDGAVLVPGVGHIWTGTVGTATKPSLAQLTTFATAGTVPSGWTDLGHTSLSDVLVFSRDGGETDVKGSWQNPSLRSVVTSQAVDSFVVKSLQAMDNSVLSLYYGGGDASVANEFALPLSPAPTEKATCVVMTDGVTPLALYCAKCSIIGDDSPDIASDDFIDFPLKFTLLQYLTNPKAVWIADLLGA